jgi:hypothetical protein
LRGCMGEESRRVKLGVRRKFLSDPNFYFCTAWSAEFDQGK